MKRPGPVRRVFGLLALTVLLASQPQLLCGIHCAVFGGATPMGAPAPHRDHGSAPLHMSGCHGGQLTAGRDVGSSRSAGLWLPVIAGAWLPRASAVAASPVAATASTSLTAPPSSPPPRA